MTTNNQKCVNCEKTGLPILPVRYSVLPKNVKAVMPEGIKGARVTDVVLDAHHYGLRTLREGWVYLFYEVGPRGNRYWEAYKVTADGRLWKQTLPLPRVPITDPACAQRAIAVPMDLITIESPEKCTGRVFVAFSEHAWHKDVFDRYVSDDTLRQARMQSVEPAKWVRSGKDASGHAIVATEQAIDDVIEYMPGFDPKLLALPDDKQSFSDEKGAYKQDWLKREVTRYPMYIRQASPASASQALVKLMKRTGMKSQDADGDSSHPPMLLALWDGVGNVHELNGFRGDPVSWLDRYVSKERPLQVGALQGIDTAQAIIQSRADQDWKNQESVMYQGTALGRPDAQSALERQRASALANATPTRAAQINAYYDDLNWMAANHASTLDQSRLISFGQSTSASTVNSSVPYIGAHRDQIMRNARAYVQEGSAERERKRTTMKSYSWSKYEARLKRREVENFRKNYKALQSEVFDLQEARSTDVGKWLQAKLFLDTLEDYQSTDLVDAIAFEVVITNGLAGIGSTPKGKAILDALVTQWDPLQPGSLIWRVFAMNQNDARQELGQLLKTALAKKDMPLESGQGQTSAGHSPGVDAVITAAGMIGKLNSYYKNLAKLALESDPKKISPLGASIKHLEVDRFGMTVGDAIYAKFRINQLGDFVGEKILQTLLLQCAGVSYSDSMALVRKQGEVEKLSREETIERISKAHLQFRADAPKSTKALYDAWNAMKSTDDGIKALRSSRIAVVAALLEAVNFYKLITAAPDRDTEIKLAQSGASMLSSLITITMTPYYAVLKDSISSQSWKMVGSGLSSFGTFISAWIDGEKAFDAADKGQSDALGIYATKALIGGAAGLATLIDTASTTAPLLKKLALRYGTVVVIEAVETATERVLAWTALKIVAGAVVRLTSWEVTVGMLMLQTMADRLTPSEFESWCSRCAFGTGQEAILIITDHSVARYSDPSQQEKDFVNAITKLL